MGPVKKMRTYVRIGKEQSPEDDGIHLRYQIEQETTSTRDL